MMVYCILIVISFIAAAVLIAVYEESASSKRIKHGKYLMICPMRGHREDAEFFLRSLYRRAQLRKGRQTRIIVVDCGMDEETAEICRLFVRDHPVIELYDIADLTKVISQNV